MQQQQQYSPAARGLGLQYALSTTSFSSSSSTYAHASAPNATTPTSMMSLQSLADPASGHMDTVLRALGGSSYNRGGAASSSSSSSSTTAVATATEVRVLFSTWVAEAASSASSEDEAFWRALHEVMRRLPDAFVRELVLGESDVLLLLLNQLGPDRGASATDIWVLCCRIVTRCFDVCGNLIWNLVDWTMADCLRDLLDVLAVLPWYMDPGAAVATAEAPLILLARLVMLCHAKWTEAATKDFCEHLERHVAICSEAGTWSPALKQCVEALALRAVSHLRQRLFEATNISNSSVSRGTGTGAKGVDVLEAVDAALIKILCVRCDCGVLASNGLLGLVASCHAAVCTCPDPAHSPAGSSAPHIVELITNRHSAVANFLFHVVQLPSFADNKTVFAMCTPALLSSANDVIKSAATVLLHRIAALMKPSDSAAFPYPKILNKCFIVESDVIIGVLSDGFKQLSALGFSIHDLIGDLIPKTSRDPAELLSSFIVGIEKVFVDICSPTALKAFGRCSGVDSCVSCREGVLKFMKTLNLLDLIINTMSRRNVFIESEIRQIKEICETLQQNLKQPGTATASTCMQKILGKVQTILAESVRALSKVPIISAPVSQYSSNASVVTSATSERKAVDLTSDRGDSREAAAAVEPSRRSSSSSSESWFSRLAQAKKEVVDESKLKKRRLNEEKNGFQFQDLRTSKPPPPPPSLSNAAFSKKETASSRVYGGSGPNTQGRDIRRYWGHEAERDDTDGYSSSSRRGGEDDAADGYSINSDRARAFIGASGGDDSLDVYQDGPKDVASLDDGYEDYEKIAEEKRKAASKAATSMAVDMDQLLGNFLGPPPSMRPNGSSANNKRLGASSSDSVARRDQSESTEHQSSTLSDFLKKVAIDIFYKHVLSIKLRSSDPSSKKVLDTVPNRFIHDDQYIEIFLPLLLSEVESSMRAFVDRIMTEDAVRARYGARNRGTAAGGGTGRGAGKSECHIISGRCVLVHTWTPPSAKDRRSNPDGFMTGSEDAASPSALRLDEVHIIAEKGPSINRDDIVIVIDAADIEGSRLLSLTEALAIPHSIAIAISSAESKTVMRAANVATRYQPQQSLIMLQGTSPSEDRDIVLVTIGSITTHLREWAALSSVRQHELMPLTPYILRASPVTSSQTLVAKRDAILKLASRLGRASDAKTISELSAQLQQRIFDLLLHRVDVSVLQVSGILDVLKNLKGAANVTSDIVDLTAEVRKTWKNQIKTDHRISTLKGMKGGRVAEIPEDVQSILKPDSVPDYLWRQLVDQYNRSQLFAIRYVVELQREDMKQDTQISLIQGPPGTGKTKTILGLVAVLLQRQRVAKPGAQASDSIASPDFAAADGSHKQKLLICAPSNAAIDELLSRLAKGVLNSKPGEGPRFFNLVRLGSVSEASSVELAEYTLDSKTNSIVEKSQLYQDFMALEEEISNLVQAINASEYQSPVVSGRASDRLPSRHELKVKLGKNIQDKMRLRAALDRMVVNVRNSILDAADVVMGTLSAAGSRQLMDYIESTHFDAEKSKDEISLPSGGIARASDLASSSNRHARRFDTVIVDESAQATEPSTLIPLRFGCRKLVLVGDPRQLPATVLDKRAASAGLGVSLFERLERSDHEVVMLQIQYRMHPEICVFPSQFFYNGKLIDSDTVQSYLPVSDGGASSLAVSTPHSVSQLFSQLAPPGFSLRVRSAITGSSSFSSFSTNGNAALASRALTTAASTSGGSFSVAYYIQRNSAIFLRSIEFIDVSTSVEENDSHNRKTLINRQEAAVVIGLLQFLTHHFRGISIGVITPYEGQKRFIRNLMMDHLSPEARGYVEINTVDGFQGREKDVVIISCVRTSRSSIGFLSDERRMNVAITRARRSLIVLGCTEALSINDPSWAAFINHVKDKNGHTMISLTPLAL